MISIEKKKNVEKIVMAQIYEAVRQHC